MRNFTPDTLTEAAVARLSGCSDTRFKEIMESLIRHLHAFVREVKLNEEEWFEGIQFLTATGQKCDRDRQEVILLSDVLGVSMMVDALSHGKPSGATESTVLGPFYIPGAPELATGANIAYGSPGEPTEVSGHVFDRDGKPIADAVLDVWQTATNGLYSIQDPEQDRYNLRGRFRTGPDGRYAFRTVKPVSYPVPTDGPVGRILDAMGRHPHRPAHIHFIVSAPGHQTLTTHIFADGDPYLDTDVVFAVKNSLVVDFKPKADGKGLAAVYDFVLAPSH